MQDNNSNITLGNESLTCKICFIRLYLLIIKFVIFMLFSQYWMKFYYLQHPCGDHLPHEGLDVILDVLEVVTAGHGFLLQGMEVWNDPGIRAHHGVDGGVKGLRIHLLGALGPPHLHVFSTIQTHHEMSTNTSSKSTQNWFWKRFCYTRDKCANSHKNIKIVYIYNLMCIIQLC